MAKLLLLNGPNLNLLGTREPDVYGHTTLADIESACEKLARDHGHELAYLQSQSESDLIQAVHDAAKGKVEFLILNPAGFTHSSVALRDAILATGIPFIEVHLSNIHAREDFRKHSYFSDIAQGVICGLGAKGYELALQSVFNTLENKTGS